jgi:hypothetical protein
MLNLIVRIARVDRYGYCGRDNHPKASDVGRYVRVVSSSTVDDSAACLSRDDERYLDLAGLAERVSRGDIDDIGEPYTVFFGYILGGRDAGRKVELIDFETEIVRVSLDDEYRDIIAEPFTL